MIARNCFSTWTDVELTTFAKFLPESEKQNWRLLSSVKRSFRETSSVCKEMSPITMKEGGRSLEDRTLFLRAQLTGMSNVR